MKALALLLALAACTPVATSGPSPAPPPTPVNQLATFTLEDLEKATILANAAGDGNGAACWAFLASLIPALKTPEPIGAATAIEVARLAQQPAFETKCKPVGVLTGLPPAFDLQVPQ